MARRRSQGSEPVDLLSEVLAQVGGVAAIRLGPAPTVLVTDPPAVQHILARRPKRYVKRPNHAPLPAGDGVLSATEATWKQQRRLLQDQFTGTGCAAMSSGSLPPL
ncbi:cytochrome P450 [Streptomyces bungoensis]|uniref:cytochrome P450 n=1 Tax=Streptomyces bungoensis TaxID=285568 RepID=UPI00342FB741